MTDLTTAAALSLAGSAIVAALATPAVAALATRFGGVDRPGERKMHVGPVPRMGGLAVFLGLIFGCSVFASVTGWSRLESVLAGDPFLLLLAPCGFVFLVGVVDDVRGLGPAPRVVGELLAAGVLIQSGFVLDRVATPFGGSVELGVLAVPLTLLWFIGVTNAYNLVDGLDGLMSALAIPALGGCAALAFAAGDDGTGIFALSLCGAVAGFLRWNWHPARIFLGDSGSLLVGFTVAAISLKVARGPGGAVSLHIPLALSAVPIIETFLTLARRYVTGRAFFHGDLSHIHHVLVKSGLSVPGAVARMGLAAGAFAVVATLSRTWRDVETVMAIAALLAGVAFALSRLRYVEVRVLLDRVRDNLLRPRRKGLADLAAVARAGDCVRGADSLADLRDRLRAAVVEGRFAYLSLELTSPAARVLGAEPHIVESRNPEADAYLASRNGSSKWLFSTESPAPPGDAAGFQTFTLALPLPAGDGRLGRLVCSRHLATDVPAPPSQDMIRYLSAPVSEVLEALEAKARAAGYADGREAFEVPYGILRTRRAMLSGEYAEPSKEDLGAAGRSHGVGL